MVELATKSLAESTRAGYRRTWSQLRAYAKSNNLLVGLPVSINLVCLFITHKYRGGNAFSTVATHTSGISYVHKILSVPDPTDNVMVKCLLNAVKKESNKRLELLPISLDMLCEILPFCDVLFNSYYDKCLFKTILLLQYHCCARIGEMVVSHKNDRNTLKTTELSFDRFGRLTVDFVYYKHGQEECSQALIIEPTNDRFCPVAAVRHYLTIRYAGKNDILFIDQGGTPIVREIVSKALKNLIISSGLEANRYDTHSLRMGRACQAASEGWTETQIKRLGRWKSNAYRKYLRGPLLCSK